MVFEKLKAIFANDKENIAKSVDEKIEEKIEEKYHIPTYFIVYEKDGTWKKRENGRTSKNFMLQMPINP